MPGRGAASHWSCLVFSPASSPRRAAPWQRCALQPQPQPQPRSLEHPRSFSRFPQAPDCGFYLLGSALPLPAPQKSPAAHRRRAPTRHGAGVCPHGAGPVHTRGTDGHTRGTSKITAHLCVTAGDSRDRPSCPHGAPRAGGSQPPPEPPPGKSRTVPTEPTPAAAGPGAPPAGQLRAPQAAAGTGLQPARPRRCRSRCARGGGAAAFPRSPPRSAAAPGAPAAAPAGWGPPFVCSPGADRGTAGVVPGRGLSRGGRRLLPRFSPPPARPGPARPDPVGRPRPPRGAPSRCPPAPRRPPVRD